MSQSNPQSPEGVSDFATADLRTELKHALLAEFERRLTESGAVSDEQRARLCRLIGNGNTSSSELMAAVTGPSE